MNRELNEAESNLLRKMKAHAHAAATEAGLEATEPLSPETLDHLWLGWDWSDHLNVDQQKVATAFFGFAFGEYLASQTGMKWRIVSDEHGDDYALVKPSTDLIAFPLATVSKRLGGPSFLASISNHDSRHSRNTHPFQTVVEVLVTDAQLGSCTGRRPLLYCAPRASLHRVAVVAGELQAVL